MRWVNLLLVAVLCVPIFSVQASAPQQQNPLSVELHEGLVGRIGRLNPVFATNNPVDRDITSLIYEGLTTINPFGEVIPDLATGWTSSADGLEYVFFLRQDVLWQDGIPFNAADVAYTFRTIRDATFPGDPALRDFWRTVEIEVLDDYTIRFRLVQPLASFPEKLRLGILPVHALEGAPIATFDQHPFNLSPIGTGAYQIENIFAENGQITGVSLRVAPTYRQRPEGQNGYLIDRIVFRTYESLEAATEAYFNGEINSLSWLPNNTIPSYQGLPNLTLHTTISPDVGVLIYNWQQDELAYFRDQRFRLAIQHATERTNIVLSTLGNRVIPSDSPIVVNSWAYNANARYPTPDLARAQALLDQVSFEPYQPPTPEAEEPEGDEEPAEPEPPPLVEQRRNFRILVVDDPGVAAVAFEIMSQWSALGFGIELDIVDPATFNARLTENDFDVALVEYSFAPSADPDQFTFWHVGQTELGQNYGGMNDNYINDLLLEARTTPYGIHRKAYYDEFQIAFTTRAPALVLYHPIFVYATTPRLQGVQLDFVSNPADRFLTIQDWYFNVES